MAEDTVMWANRVYYRDGETRLVGPYGSKAEAVANKPGGTDIVSATTVRVKGLTGGPHVLDERKTHAKVEIFEVLGVNAPGDPGSLRVTGDGLLNLHRLRVFYNGGNSTINFTVFDTQTDTQVIVTHPSLEGQTVTEVELYDGEDVLHAVVDGLSVLIPTSVSPTVSSITADNFECVIAGTGLLVVTQVNFQGYVWPDNNFFGEALASNPAVTNWTDTEIRIDMTSALVSNMDAIVHQVDLIWSGSPVQTVLSAPDMLSFDGGVVNASLLNNHIHLTVPGWRNWKVVECVLHFDDLSDSGVLTKGTTPFDDWDDTYWGIEQAPYAGKTIVSVDVWRNHAGDPGNETTEGNMLLSSPLSIPGGSHSGWTLGTNGQGTNRGGSQILHAGSNYFVSTNVNDGDIGNPALSRLAADGQYQFHVSTDLASWPRTAYGLCTDGTSLWLAHDAALSGVQNAFITKYDQNGSPDGGFGDFGFGNKRVGEGVNQGSPAPRCLFYDGTNNFLVIGWNDSNTATARITRLDASTGAQADDHAFTNFFIFGMYQITDEVYLVAGQDNNLGQFVVRKYDAGSQTVLDFGALPANYNCSPNGQMGLAVDDSANIYVTGRNNLGGGALVKFQPSLDLDTNFGPAGMNTFNQGGWLDTALEQPLWDNNNARVIVCGWYGDNTGYFPYTAAMFGDGTLDVSYGTSGFAALVIDVSTDGMIYDAAFDPTAAGTVLLTGYVNDPNPPSKMWAGRIDSTGALDTAFGNFA